MSDWGDRLERLSGRVRWGGEVFIRCDGRVVGRGGGDGGHLESRAVAEVVLGKGGHRGVDRFHRCVHYDDFWVDQNDGYEKEMGTVVEGMRLSPL